MAKEDFGRWLRLLRVRNGLNQEDLAKLLDIDQTTVSRIERGTQGVSKAVVEAIASHFAFSVDEVWGMAEAVEDAPPAAPSDSEQASPGLIPAYMARISRASLDVARRIDSLPPGERRRTLAAIRAILFTAEDEVERAESFPYSPPSSSPPASGESAMFAMSGQ